MLSRLISSLYLYTIYVVTYIKMSLSMVQIHTPYPLQDLLNH